MDPSNEDIARVLAMRGYPDEQQRQTGSKSWRTDEIEADTLIQQDSSPDPVLEFQRFYGLEETGVVDPKTEALLFAPRCGVPDKPRPAALMTGRHKWPKNDLTISVANGIPGASIKLIQTLVETAANTWSKATQNRISIARAIADGDMVISFGSGDHGDPWPFSGPGSELAHAFHPNWVPAKYAGQIHFDESEKWSFSPVCPPDKKDFLSVAIHEIGHALGLSHVGTKDSVMYANYNGVQRVLYPKDIESISSLY